jgi:hypothetical protein
MLEVSRRDFLKFMGLAALSPLVHASPVVRAQTRKVYLVTVGVAGFSYYEGMEEAVFNALAVGDELELRREPENPHDPNAIEVYTQNGYKLGYVPMIENPIPAALADQNIAIGAEISGLIDAPADNLDDYLEDDEDDDSEYLSPVQMRLYMIILA